MSHLRKTARHWIGLAAACAALSFGGMVHAQQPAPAAPALAAEQAMTVALSDQPIDAARLAWGHRLTKAMTMDTRLAEVLDMQLASLREQVLASLAANAPPERKAMFIAALDEALTGVKAEMLAKLDTGYSRYFAVSMTPATLTELTTFYESPLGQKAIRTPTAMTEAENQAMGQYYIDHPAIMEGLAATIGGAMVSQRVMQQDPGALAKSFKVKLCQSLKTRGATPASCAVAG